MKFNRLILAAMVGIAACFSGCEPKTDAQIRAEIETKLKAVPDMAAVKVDVAGGIASIEGACKDDACKISCEKIAQGVPGVKTVINNLQVENAPPAADTATAAPVKVAPVEAAPIDSAAVAAPVQGKTDDPLTKSVMKVTNRYPTVKAAIENGVVTLTGDIRKTELPVLLRSLRALKPKKIEQQLRVVKATAPAPRQKAKKRNRRNR